MSLAKQRRGGQTDAGIGDRPCPVQGDYHYIQGSPKAMTTEVGRLLCYRGAHLSMASYLMTGGGPGRSNYFNETIAPPLKLVWQWELPRDVTAVPSIPLQHTRFLSVCDVAFPSKTGHLFCLDSESGAELWKRSSPGMKAPALACISQDFILWFIRRQICEVFRLRLLIHRLP